MLAPLITLDSLNNLNRSKPGGGEADSAYANFKHLLLFYFFVETMQNFVTLEIYLWEQFGMVGDSSLYLMSSWQDF